jgi:hypothetical protein
MALPEPLPEQARRLLATARRSRRAARDAMRELELDAQVALVCETPVARRSALLDLVPEPERVIPELPEAELCFTAKAVGLHDAGWILEHATPEQMVACVDLDAWSEFVPDPEGVDAWIQAFADAGAPTLVTAARELDAELLVLWLRWRVEVALRPQDDDWTPAPGAQTLDQQFYYRARRDGDDLEEVALLLRSLFTEDYWLYFRLMQGVIWEMQSDAEEWAGRWRQGRIQDLGFPPWDEAMRIYGYLRPDRRTEIPSEGGRPVAEWKLPVWLPRIPEASTTRHSLFRAIEKLDGPERAGCFYALVALSNKVAVADRLPLGDSESIPASIEKAAAHASRGLDFVARENGLDPTEALRRLSLERLFRVGASLGQGHPAGPPVTSDEG